MKKPNRKQTLWILIICKVVMEYSIILDSGDFLSFLIEKSSHVYNTWRMIRKDNEIFPLLTCARFTIRPPLPFTRIKRLLLFLQFFPLFSTYTVSSLVSAISEVVFTVFSRNLSKSMQDKNMRLCAATVGDIIFPNEVFCLVVATSYWIKIRAIRW